MMCKHCANFDVKQAADEATTEKYFLEHRLTFADIFIICSPSTFLFRINKRDFQTT